MNATLLSILYALCSVVLILNIRTLWRDKEVKGVSLIPTVIFTVTNVVEIPYFFSNGDLMLAIGALFMAGCNLVWLCLAALYRVRWTDIITG